MSVDMGDPSFRPNRSLLLFLARGRSGSRDDEHRAQGKDDRHVHRQSIPRKMCSDFEFLRTYTFHPTVTPQWKYFHLSPGG